MYRSLTGFRSLSSYHGIPIRALEGSSNSNLPEISLHKRRHDESFHRHAILTLDPTKFSEKKQHRLHIGDLKSFTPYVSLLGKSSLVMSPSMRYEMKAIKEQRYPPDTKAFLYYTISAEKPRVAGELRLRVTSSEDHSSFENGSDLLLSNGRAWSRPLYFLPKYYAPLYEKLREERLVQDDLDAVLSNLPSKQSPYSRSSFLYSLNDTFIVDFSSTRSSLSVVTEQGIELLLLNYIFYDNRGLYNCLPYTGSALARLERSTLLEHKDTRTVVLRFLKIITPVKCVIPLYDGHLCLPEEGSLLQKLDTVKRKYRVWSFDIDNSRVIKRGLQFLWDA